MKSDAVRSSHTKYTERLRCSYFKGIKVVIRKCGFVKGFVVNGDNELKNDFGRNSLSYDSMWKKYHKRSGGRKMGRIQFVIRKATESLTFYEIKSTYLPTFTIVTFLVKIELYLDIVFFLQKLYSRTFSLT